MSEGKPRPKFTVTWLDAKREPQVRFDRAYPGGIDLDVSLGALPACVVELEWPAERVGAWAIECQTCGQSVAVTAAGRVDDPRSVKMVCMGGGPRDG